MTLDITPLTGTLGAEVRGIDLAAVDRGTAEELHKAWLDHKVLVFRDQPIDAAAHLAFASMFGEVDSRPSATDTHPELTVLQTDDARRFVASGWHSDITSDQRPAKGAVLRARVVPVVGGDTCFADTAAVYQRLSGEWKARLEGLETVHPMTGVRHRVIWVHPETGAPAVYTNRFFSHRIDGLAEREAREIAWHLEEAIRDPSVQCRVRWEVDTFVLYDNRCTQHCGTDDHVPAERRMERVTLLDDAPPGGRS